MSRPRIFTAEFWSKRIDAATDSVRPVVRQGANAVLLALGQDVTGLDVFAVSASLLVGAFVGGCVVAILTTLAAPPQH